MLGDFQSPIDFLQEKTRLLNEYLSRSYSPLQLIAISTLVTLFGVSVHQFLCEDDEGTIRLFGEIHGAKFSFYGIDLVVRIRETLFRLVRRLPAVQRKIATARRDTLKSVCGDIARSVKGHEFTKTLPERGLSKVEFFVLEREEVFYLNFFRRKCCKNWRIIKISKKSTTNLAMSPAVSINSRNRK